VLAIGLAGDYASVSLGIIEQLGETAYLVVAAGAEGLFASSGITVPLSGQFIYCPREPVLIDQGTWACPVDTGVECDSPRHQLALVRR
jgi:hypothetical protein